MLSYLRNRCGFVVFLNISDVIYNCFKKLKKTFESNDEDSFQDRHIKHIDVIISQLLILPPRLTVIVNTRILSYLQGYQLKLFPFAIHSRRPKGPPESLCGV